jgi:hypothetical protein
VTAPDGGPQAQLGSSVGRRIGDLVSRSVVDTRRRLADHTQRTALGVFTDATNHVSDEIRGVMGPLFRQIALDPDTPPDLAKLFHKLGTERGQAWAWIAGQSVGLGMAGGLGNLLTNLMNPGILPIIADHPHGVLDPGTAASAAVRGTIDPAVARRDAASSGLNAMRYNAIAAMQYTQPGLPEMHALLNKGASTIADVRDSLRRVGIPANYIDDLIDLRNAELSGPDIAAMWNRGIISESQANALGRRVGLNATQVGRLLQLGGEPPAPDELLLAWRRGIISESQVDRALRQGPLRFEWIPVIKSLQWQPLPLAEAADAVNQGHMTLGEARRVARENGVRNDDFQVIVDNAGIPPGPQEALDWVNRGLISEAQFRTAFLESRIKNKYIDLYLRSRVEIMPPETIRLMYSRGAMTERDALHRLQQRGYTAEDAAIILDGASAEKTKTSRDLTVAQVRDLYTDRLISRAAALKMFDAAGYSADESLWILELADLARVKRFVTAAVNRIKSGYVNGLLSEAESQAQLDAVGVAPDAKDDMLALWDIERATVTRGLTPAQIVAAVKKGFMPADAGMSRLVGQGYDPADALILLQIGGALQS